MDTLHKKEMQERIDNMLDAGAFDGTEVIMFGHCNATEETVDYLAEKKVPVTAILDNSAAKQFLTYRNIPIVPPTNILHYENCIVLIAARFFEQMFTQLRELGFAGQITKVVDYNTFAEYSLSETTVRRKVERMLRGREILTKIRNEFSLSHLVICPNNALGDVYWAMAFLPQYCVKKSIRDVAIIVIENSCKEVAEMFDNTKVVKLSAAEMDELVQALIFTREDNCIIAHHEYPYTDRIFGWLEKHFLSFVDYYRCAVYGLPQSTTPTLPANLRAYGQRHLLEENKSVIIAPYAKSVVELPAKFWNDIVRKYKADGYSVFTNIGKDESALAGTTPLNIPLSQVISAVEYAGVFIALRSGLCDIVNSAKCRKIMIYPDCYYSSTKWKVADFFALPDWEVRIV